MKALFKLIHNHHHLRKISPSLSFSHFYKFYLLVEVGFTSVAKFKDLGHKMVIISSGVLATSNDEECCGRTIMVGITMEEESRGILTWSLMKAARPGDRVVAIHVVTYSDQSSGQAEEYSLFSLVKAFDSVLSVFEGFCNLKQVELKLKICRGSSVPKILIREANSLAADIAVVGTSRTHNNAIWRSNSVAKYLSRKLPKECSVLAVRSGKVVFQRESAPRTIEGSPDSCDEESSQKSCRVDCSISCFPDPTFPRVPDDKFFVDKNEAKPLAVIPSSLSEAEIKPGWPLLRRSIYLSSMSAGSFSPNDTFKILPNELERLQDKYSSTCRIFSYKELSAATSNFLLENVIGEGGNSVVYRGRLPNEKEELAVKVLKPSKQALKEFLLELEILTTLNHRNILSLQGFCFENSTLILVYDFVPKGSLEEILHGAHIFNIFWNQRYKVALGIAEALEYLHSGNAEPIIHRDVKSSNILLADSFEPKLSDFGLSEKIPSSSSYHTCTDVAGTFGYLAPEYFMYGKINNKIDVYAFGVVLLELLSGRKPISNEYPKGQGSLVLWAMPILRDGKLSQLLDPKLSGDYDQQKIEDMALAAMLCLRREPRARPSMKIILKVLEGNPGMTKWARAQANTFDTLDGPSRDLKALLDFALSEVDDDSVSMSSTHKNISLESYLQRRCSCSSGSE